jgi:hypothetical protein
MMGSPSFNPYVQPLPLTVPGPLSVGTVPMLIPSPATWSIVNVRATAYTPSVGADIIADVLVNGVSVFTTQSKRPTVPAGVNAGPVTVPDNQTVTTGSNISLAIDQVGSTTAGVGLCVLLELQYVGP